MGEPRSATRFVDLDTVALLELVRAGDYDAYGELYTRYHDFAYKVARRASRRHADDLVAESFRRVLTAISRGAGPTQAFGPYLATTIRSAAAGLAAPYQEVELEVNNLLTDEHGEVDPRVSTAYLSLPEQWQNALWYADVEGLSPRHAAPLLGLPTANAFSALRKRARAGLRSAYLTQVVDAACNEHVRRHLELLMAGTTTAAVVDDLVDQHLRECDECAAIAWRVAAVTGNRVGLVLAPALLAFHGFASSGALLPVGIGLPGILAWLRRLPKSVAAAGTTTVAGGLTVAAVALGSMLAGSADQPPAEADDRGAPIATERADSAFETAPTSGADAGGDQSAPRVLGGASGPPTTRDPVPTSEPPPASAPANATTSTVPIASPSFATVPGATVTTSSVAATTVSSAAPTVPSTGGATTVTTVTTSSTSPTTATAPSTTTRASPTTSPPPTTTPPTSTTPTTTATTATTTTTSTTMAPVAPGRLSIGSDEIIVVGNDPQRQIRLDVVDTTGAAGTIGFSRSIDPLVAKNLTCSSTACTLAGNTRDGFVIFRTALGPMTIVLRAAGGAVVQTVTL